MFTRAFLKAASERAIKSAAQAAALVLGAEAVNVFAVSWVDVAGLSAGAAVLSLLTSVGSSQIGAAGPSVANEVLSPPAPKIEA